MERTKLPEKIQQFELPSIIIPAEVLFNSELSNTEKILFGLIHNLTHSETGCCASNKYLAGLLNTKSQTITNGLANLRKHQYVTITFETRIIDGMQIRHVFIDNKFLKL